MINKFLILGASIYIIDLVLIYFVNKTHGWSLITGIIFILSIGLIVRGLEEWDRRACFKPNDQRSEKREESS